MAIVAGSLGFSPNRRDRAGRRADGEHDADREPDGEERPGLPQDQDEDVPAGRAERHAHADLVPAPYDHVRDDPVEADHREDRREESEERREGRHQALAQAGRREISPKARNVRAISGLTPRDRGGRRRRQAPTAGRSERTRIEVHGARLVVLGLGEEDDRREVLAQRRCTWCPARGRRSGSDGRFAGRLSICTTRPIGLRAGQELCERRSRSRSRRARNRARRASSKSRPASNVVPIVAEVAGTDAVEVRVLRLTSVPATLMSSFQSLPPERHEARQAGARTPGATLHALEQLPAERDALLARELRGA